tara:strand:- start:10820 stop:11671 length:852 start_codon:yes stop_codon:yes gene_type:complete
MTTFAEKVGEIVDDLELEKKYDKSIIKHRFLDEISYYEQKRDHTKKYYNIFRFIVTTGSILLPAILSMGQMDPAKLPKNFDMITYWASWTISLAVTASNGFLQLFSLDKNYFSYSMVVEQLKTEGWQFFGLSGKYEDYDSHQEAYRNFSKSVESIKRKQVEQEFSNGKGDSKKKKFDFQGEMKKFQNEQTNTQSVIKDKTQDLLTNKVLNDEDLKEKLLREALLKKDDLIPKNISERQNDIENFIQGITDDNDNDNDGKKNDDDEKNIDDKKIDDDKKNDDKK